MTIAERVARIEREMAAVVVPRGPECMKDMAIELHLIREREEAERAR